MRELRPGLWHWAAPHPDWTPSEPWGQEVSSYAIDDGERLLLFDPLAWHERDTQSLVEQLGAPVFVPPPSEIVELAAERDPVVVLTAPWVSRRPIALA